MKVINITISGALGRMGRILIGQISKNKIFKIHSLTDLKKGKKINGVKVQRNNLEAFKDTDIIIDFSRPESCIEVLSFVKKLKKKNCDWNNWFYKKTGESYKKLFKNICYI
jgi:4-hydroxy-tetrahydrodipicolinate reductase